LAILLFSFIQKKRKSLEFKDLNLIQRLPHFKVNPKSLIKNFLGFIFIRRGFEKRLSVVLHLEDGKTIKSFSISYGLYENKIFE